MNVLVEHPVAVGVDESKVASSVRGGTLTCRARVADCPADNAAR